jgi:hypothetical protein
MTGVPAIAMFFVTEGEEIVFGSGEAMKAELEIGAGAGEFSFGFTYG